MMITSGEETRLFCVKDSMHRAAPCSDAKSSKVSSSILCVSTETPAPMEKEREKEKREGGKETDRQTQKEREHMRRNEGKNWWMMDGWMNRDHQLCQV